MNRAIREARGLLEMVADTGALGSYAQKDAARLLGLPPFAKRPKAPRKALRTRAQDREAKRAKHAAETARIRAVVMRRADGVCEACQFPSPFPLHLDHLESGNGRRRQLQSPETCWGICPPCHRDRTNNSPSPGTWAAVIRQWAKRHGFPVPARYRT